MEKLSRRDFVRGVAAAGVATAAAGMMTACTKKAEAEQTWDQETEVLVVGMGDAGLAAAISAADAGSKVLVLEKAPEKYCGGNSRVCAQATWAPQDTTKAIAYVKDITQGYHLEDLTDAHIKVFIEESKKNLDWLSNTIGMPTRTLQSPEYPASTNAEGTCVAHKEGFGLQRTWKAIFDAAKKRNTITFAYETPLTDLVFDSTGQVIGAKATSGGKEIAIKASKGVVLCLGGFEFNTAMKANYTLAPAPSWGTPYNTGDGINICMKYDIDFWHMNSATPGTTLGAFLPYADKDFLESPVCTSPSGGNYIWTDKYGQRFMDESRDYQHGYGRNAMFYNDSEKMEYPRIPLWQVFDQTFYSKGLLGAMGGICGWTEQIGGLTWTKDLAKEISAGVVLKGDTVEALAAQMKVDPATLKATVDRYNGFAAAGADADFGRAAKNLAQLTGPFYAVSLYPVMVNTNGGPRRNEKAQIVHTDGSAVPRLYSAGEFGSIWAWYYQGAGNTGEAMAMGRVAGANAASETAWDAKA